MSHLQIIDEFLSRVRNRLNRFLLLDCLFWSLAAMAALLTIVCLVYLTRGYAVPRIWYAVAGGGVLLATLLLWSFRRWTDRRAAHYADDSFHLKDSLSSSLSFRSRDREGGFIHLQEKTTAHQIASLDPNTIRYRWPRRILVAALTLVLLSGSLAFKQASPAVVQRQQIEAETAAKTREINEFLEELVEELERETGEQEDAALDPDELREWFKKLEETKDRKKAMRQYAQLERKLSEAARRLDQRKNEQLLSKAGEELQKDAENRQLGRKLEEKKYEKAAQDLEGMKASKIDPKKLSEQKKELARLKSAAQRMAAAANAANRQAASSNKIGQQKIGKSTSDGDQSTLSKSSNQQSGESGDSGNNQRNGSLIEEMLALEKSMKELEKSLADCTNEEKRQGKCSKDSLAKCENCRRAVSDDIDKLSKSLRQCNARRMSQMKLLSLCKKTGQCQRYLSQSQSPSTSQPASLRQCVSLRQFMSMTPGGKKAGVGSDQSRRDQRDPLVDNGNTTQLKGIQGSGPVQSTIEAADEGSGVSTRRNVKQKLEFSRQIESFVQREDVPEDVKRGVKEYFESIHQGE